MASGSGAGPRAIENDALIESSFRRLLSSIEAERESIRATWQQIEQEKEGTTSELERIRQDTGDWCLGERQKIEAEWKRLDKISDRMSHMWPEATVILEINCVGTFFSIPKSTLCSINDSWFATMFSDQHIASIPKDSEGRYFLDYNPVCFQIMVDYLLNRRLKIDAPTPIIPEAQRDNMELFAQALNLAPFLNENTISQVHGTSLAVRGNEVTATHPGWQVVAASQPLRMAGPSYFEVKVLANPDTRGGLAIGICDHVPQGHEVHSIRLSGCVMYNSNNGIIGDVVGQESEVQPKIQFEKGSKLGIKYDVASRTLHWYFNAHPIGSSTFKSEDEDPGGRHPMKTLYPVFALYCPDQKIQVDFNATMPKQGSQLAIDTGLAGSPPGPASPQHG